VSEAGLELSLKAVDLVVQQANQATAIGLAVIALNAAVFDPLKLRIPPNLSTQSAST
jgi:hypothetical protein